MTDSLDAFEDQVRTAAASFVSSERVSIVARTLLTVKLRVDVTAARFVAVFFNVGNGRIDLSVIDHGRRIFGYDNLGDWHEHPLGRPDDHRQCAPRTLGAFFQKVAELP